MYKTNISFWLKIVKFCSFFLRFKNTYQTINCYLRLPRRYILRLFPLKWYAVQFGLQTRRFLNAQQVPRRLSNHTKRHNIRKARNHKLRIYYYALQNIQQFEIHSRLHYAILFVVDYLSTRLLPRTEWQHQSEKWIRKHVQRTGRGLF